MRILGISSFYHDSAAALIKDGEIIAAAQEERFTRIKHDKSFPTNAVKFCLDFEGIELNDIDAVAFYDKPLLKFERLIETYYNFAPRGLRSFIASMPVWLSEKMFLKRLIKKELKAIDQKYSDKIKLLFPEHHLSHAASAFYATNFEKSAILTLDGVGEWATASICKGEGKSIEILKELKFPHSIGLLYSAFTYFLGFRVNSGEYKLMGLAPYGNAESDQVKRFIEIIKTELISIKEDGSLWLNQKYFNYATGLRMVFDKKWERLFGMKKRNSTDELEQQHCDLGLAIQKITEEVVIKMASEAKKLTGSDNICMAGGVALNCVANGVLQNSKVFENLFFQPASGDAGGAPGAALAAYHIYFEQERKIDTRPDKMQGSYLGPEFFDEDVRKLSNKYEADKKYYSDFDTMCAEVAIHIDKGNVIGWFQGRMEFGPRALGARSILGDARNEEMQKKLNLKIKYRESFRPFAPSVLFEDRQKYFDLESSSPYMMLVKDVAEQRRNKLPPDYNNKNISDKLYFLRSDIPAVTHIDFSARIQTVHENTNSYYYKLLSAFKSLTGHGLLVNTSFNVRGEPIVCTPDDAYRCFMRTEMDFLVIGNYLFDKKLQPEWQEKDKWEEEFVLD